MTTKILVPLVKQHGMKPKSSSIQNTVIKNNTSKSMKQQVDAILQSCFADASYWESGEQEGVPTELTVKPKWSKQ
jgi:hypothetical protein